MPTRPIRKSKALSMNFNVKQLLIVFLLSSPELLAAQPRVEGPACVIPGVTYVYSLKNIGSWPATGATMKICLTGGNIVDASQTPLGNCIESGEPLANVLVVWNDTVAAKVTLTVPSGNAQFQVAITEALGGGFIDSTGREQYYSDTTSIPAPLACSPASGGSCSPNYNYQWQSSLDGFLWTNIDSATQQGLTFSAPARQSRFYRRQTIESSSGTVVYSDIATISVSVGVQGGN